MRQPWMNRAGAARATGPPSERHSGNAVRGSIPIAAAPPGARSSLPAYVRRSLRYAHREWSFRRAVQAFRRDPASATDAGSHVLADLTYGWGNEGYSAGNEFLAACIASALVAKSAMLECGSGLTTIVLGIVAERRRLPLWTLEHLEEWAEPVRRRLAALRLPAVHLCAGPLTQYPEFDWYTPPLGAMPRAFDLVVCDGPPGATRGGRVGLVPVMRERLAPGAVILLDDASRSPERLIAERWARELHAHYDVVGFRRPFIRMTVGS